MTEGSGITLRNVRLITKDTDPVLNIHNSQNITLTNIDYINGEEVPLNVTGEKSKLVSVTGTDKSKTKERLSANYGATEDAVKMQ